MGPALRRRANPGDVALAMLTFEDFPEGHFMTLGPCRVTRDDIIAFAKEFDPQPMHLDETAAAQSLLGGLSGSGWHMCALAMRMQVDGYLHRSRSFGGLGVEEVRWLAPLRPDDLVTLEVHVDTKRLSKSRPGAGIIHFRSEMFNAARQRLMTLVSIGLMACRASQEAKSRAVL
jgi:acyl dehydratase